MNKPMYLKPIRPGYVWPETCSLCGALVEGHPETKKLHDDWHEWLDTMLGKGIE